MSVVSRAAGKLAAQNIKNETAISANTATRVGTNMEDGWDTFALDADLTVVENTAIFESDTSLAGASFFLDEDDMSSDSATKVASQQSIKAYVTNSLVTPNSTLIRDEADFPTPTAGVITLTSGNIYRIEGEVVITNKIDCNGAILLGRDRTVDKITSAENSSEIFTNDGQVIAQNLTFAITGTSSKIFNLLGTTGFEYVYLQDCTLAASTSTGDIENFYAVQFINTPNQNPSGGLTLTDITNISLRGFDTSVGHSASTVLTITGTSNLVQIFFCGFGVGGGQTALDISGLTLSTYGEISAGSGFSGAGTYVNGTFGDLWKIDARGLDRLGDSTAVGSLYVSTPAETSIATVNTPVKVAGTTTLVESVRVDDDSSTNNRLKYTGLKTRNFTITSAISTTSASSNKEFTWYVAVNGTVDTASGIRRKQGTGSDVGALALNWIEELSTDDYIEIWVENNTDDTNVTATKLTLIIS